MEISNQQIANVLAPYLGQDMITKTRHYEGEGKPAKYLKGKFLEIDLGMIDSFIGVLLENETEPSNHTNYTINEVKLILKPLSEITKEDAIEVARICNCGNWTIERKLEYKKTTYKTPFAQLYTEYEDRKQVLISFDNEGFKVHNGNEYYHTHVPSHQYLISKGYDLPNYLLGGKTLNEAGLAIYENEN